MKFGKPKMNLNRDILILLGFVIIMHIALYIVTPVLPVVLSTDKGLTPAQVGVVVGAVPLSSQIGCLVGGIMSDTIGRRTAMVIGYAVQSAAFFGYAVSSTFTSLFLFSILSGTGSGVYAPTLKAAIASIASSSHDTGTTAFSLRGISANIGVSIAGLLTLYFSTQKSTVPFFTASAIFLSLAVLSWMFIPKRCRGKECPNIPVSSYLQIIKNKPFIIFSLVSVLVWALYSQLNLLLPLRGGAVLENGRMVGTIWTITGIALIIFQGLISKYILQRLNPLTSLTAGVLFLGGGIFLIGLSYNFWHLTLSALVFLMGEMLMLPTTDSITSQLAHPHLIGAYFSIANLVSGIGTAAGNFAGGALISTYGVKSSIYPWIIPAIFGILTSCLILIIKKLPSISSSLKRK